MDECTGLENRRGGNSTVGSNPTPSARNLDSQQSVACLTIWVKSLRRNSAKHVRSPAGAVALGWIC